MNKYIHLVALFVLPLLLVATPPFSSPSWAESEDELVLPESIDPGHVWRMSLNEALAIAIKNNLGIQVQNEQVAIGRANLRARKGSYEPNLTASYDYSDSISPPASSLDGAPGTTFQSLNQRWSVALQQRISTGTNLGLNFFSTRNKSSLGSAVEPLFYGSNLSVSVDQPLLRGFSIDGDVPGASILRAEFANKKNLEDKRGVIAGEVRRTEDAYWNLVQATRSYGVQYASLESAREQLDLTERQIKAGILAPADLIGSESSVAQRELELVQADNNLSSSMDALRHALNLPEEKWSQSLLAIDLPQITPRQVTLEQAMKDALANRHEIQVNKIDQEIAELNQRVADNNRLPDLNVGFRYGLAGQSNVYSGAIEQLQGLGARNWGVFVNLNWTPLGREASANQASNLSATRMLALQHQQFLNGLRNELRASLRALETSQRRVTASEKFRLLAERSLEAERNRFLNGKSRNLDVTLREDNLARARTAEISARIQFVKASSDLDLATGQLLERKNIQLSVR
jgi:outer membrane protein TolC